MGMAASQARLLELTARIHDVEYQAQSIQNAKLQLATQEDEVQRKYLEALDDETLTVKDYNGNLIPANFNNLCGIDSVRSGNFRYALKNEKNQLIVDDDIYDAYMSAEVNDAYSFAMYMFIGSINDVIDEGEAIKNKEQFFIQDDENLAKLQKQANELLLEAEKLMPGGSELEQDKEADVEDYIASFNSNDETYDQVKEKWDKYLELQKQIKYKLYKAHAEEIYNAGDFGVPFDEEDFQYYIDIYKQIEANGGQIVKISDYNGIDGIGNAASDGDWLENMIKSGRITIDIAKTNKVGDCEFTATSVPTDTSLEYTTTSTIDKTALAKAEAEYEHDLKKINRKDKAYDMELSKLETERQALTTQYDSVKKVVEDNIERTFGIFS